MDCRIADTFADSRTRTVPDEQKTVKNMPYDLEINPGKSDMNLYWWKMDRL